MSEQPSKLPTIVGIVLGLVLFLMGLSSALNGTNLTFNYTFAAAGLVVFLISLVAYIRRVREK